MQGFSWDAVSLLIVEVAPGLASGPLASIFSEVTGVECGILSTHDEIHRGLKSQTPTDVRLLNRRTSAGELCRNKKLLMSQLREGDKFTDQFDSYLSTRVGCDKVIIVQFVKIKLAAFNSSFAKPKLISFALSLYFRVRFLVLSN